jgi:hypothetical protein
VKTAALVSTLVLLFAGTGSAQEMRKDRWPGENAARYDRAMRQELAEQLVNKQESEIGRKYDAAFRRDVVRRLASRSVDELRNGQSADLIRALSLGDPQTDLVYVPLLAPCRVVDTRIAGGVLYPGIDRNYRVAGPTFAAQGGNPGDCGVPFGPTDAVVINLVAVNPYGAGNMKGAASGTTIPPTGSSLLNYQLLTPNLNIANGVVLAVCQGPCGNDIVLQTNGSATHIVADVLGYFKPFPLNEVTTLIETTGSGLHPFLTSTCTGYDNVSIDVPAAGKIWVRGTVLFQIAHSSGQTALFTASLRSAPANCGGSRETKDIVNIDTGVGSLSGIPIGASQVERSFDVVFDVTAAGVYTYYLNGVRDSGGGDNASLRWITLTAVYLPNQPDSGGLAGVTPLIEP